MSPSTTPQPQPASTGIHIPRQVQFSIFLDNRVGRLLSLMEIFDGKAVTLAGFSILEATGHAVVRLLTSDAAAARGILSRNEYPFSEDEILAVQFGDGHTLTAMCDVLLQEHLSIHYTYPLMVRPRGFPVLALHCENFRLAGRLLTAKGFVLLDERDLK